MAPWMDFSLLQYKLLRNIWNPLCASWLSLNTLRLDKRCPIHQGRRCFTTCLFQRHVSIFCIRSLSLFLISLRLKYLNTTLRGSSGKVVMRKMKIFKLWGLSCVETGIFYRRSLSEEKKKALIILEKGII